MNDHLLPLAPGTHAPDFLLRQSPSDNVSLHRLTGLPTILVFHPMAFEPVSQEQLTLYQEYLPEFEGFGARLLGISAEHVWCNQAFMRETRIQFPLLSDIPPSGHVSRLYGVYREEQQVTARALFVIDRGGIIRFSEAYPDLLNPGVDDLLKVLEELPSADNGRSRHG